MIAVRFVSRPRHAQPARRPAPALGHAARGRLSADPAEAGRNSGYSRRSNFALLDHRSEGSGVPVMVRSGSCRRARRGSAADWNSVVADHAGTGHHLPPRTERKLGSLLVHFGTGATTPQMIAQLNAPINACSCDSHVYALAYLARFRPPEAWQRLRFQIATDEAQCGGHLFRWISEETTAPILKSVRDHSCGLCWGSTKVVPRGKESVIARCGGPVRWMMEALSPGLIRHEEENGEQQQCRRRCPVIETSKSPATAPSR
jgi:hypothetical protein